MFASTYRGRDEHINSLPEIVDKPYLEIIDDAVTALGLVEGIRSFQLWYTCISLPPRPIEHSEVGLQQGKLWQAVHRSSCLSALRILHLRLDVAHVPSVVENVLPKTNTPLLSCVDELHLYYRQGSCQQYILPHESEAMQSLIRQVRQTVRFLSLKHEGFTVENRFQAPPLSHNLGYFPLLDRFHYDWPYPTEIGYHIRRLNLFFRLHGSTLQHLVVNGAQSLRWFSFLKPEDPGFNNALTGWRLSTIVIDLPSTHELLVPEIIVSLQSCSNTLTNLSLNGPTHTRPTGNNPMLDIIQSLTVPTGSLLRRFRFSIDVIDLKLIRALSINLEQLEVLDVTFRWLLRPPSAQSIHDIIEELPPSLRSHPYYVRYSLILVQFRI